MVAVPLKRKFSCKALENHFSSLNLFQSIMKIMVSMARGVHSQIRRQEKLIMNTCIRRAKMPRKTFMEALMAMKVIKLDRKRSKKRF